MCKSSSSYFELEMQGYFSDTGRLQTEFLYWLKYIARQMYEARVVYENSPIFNLSPLQWKIILDIISDL